MNRIFILILMLCLLAGCNNTNTQTSAYKTLADQYAEIELNTCLIDSLSDNERKIVNIFIQVADIMDEIYWKEAYGDKEELFKNVTDSSLIKYISINYGPWDRLNGNTSFIPQTKEKPLGANFYPENMTKAEFEALKDPHKTDWYSIIRRNSKHELCVIPYHEAFPELTQKAAQLLLEAAQLAESAGLKKYLNLRAQALLTDDYLASDLAWMDMQDNRLDFVVGPIETYEDALFGYKAAHSGQILIKDIDESSRYSMYATYIPKLQEYLPVPPEYKSSSSFANPDLNVYDIIYYAGDCNAGSKNIAINLPNDPRVHALKGSRKLQLRNSMQAKFDTILVPISKLVIDPKQINHIKFNAFFENTMFHEIAHGLGVKYTLADSSIDIRTALKDCYTSIEEGKADILGLHCLTLMTEWGIIAGNDLMDNYVTFVAGIFRSTRFGSASAHGKANMMQFAYFIENGAITRNADFYTINYEKMKEAISTLANEYITIEGDADYNKAKALISQKGIVTPDLQKDLDKIASAGIPKDIYFSQGKQILESK